MTALRVLDLFSGIAGFSLGFTDLKQDNVDITNKFPQAWLDGSWEEGISRTTTRRDGRVERLKQLGNAVVPQIPELIGRAILDVEREKNGNKT